jgi:hypothetical protein
VLYINDLACSGVLILFYFVLISPSGETLNKILVLNSTFDIAYVKLELENRNFKTRTLEQNCQHANDAHATKRTGIICWVCTERDLMAQLTHS